MMPYSECKISRSLQPLCKGDLFVDITSTASTYFRQRGGSALKHKVEEEEGKEEQIQQTVHAHYNKLLHMDYSAVGAAYFCLKV